MNNSYLHLLQISISNLRKQIDKIKKNFKNLFENGDNEKNVEELFKNSFDIELRLDDEKTSNEIIDEFLKKCFN